MRDAFPSSAKELGLTGEPTMDLESEKAGALRAEPWRIELPNWVSSLASAWSVRNFDGETGGSFSGEAAGALRGEAESREAFRL